MSRRIAITGYGIITASGCGAEAVWDSIREGRSGLGPLTLFESLRWRDQRVGQVREDLAAFSREAGAPPGGSRSDRMAWLAVREASVMAGLDAGRLSESGLILGATTGGIDGTERALEAWIRRRRAELRPLYFHECASAADRCARSFGLRGPVLTVSTACSSGSMSIGMAADMIRLGRVRRMIAGGVDSLCRLTLNGFNSLLLVDPSGCRPFDAARSGLTLGEGAAAVVLEDESEARARGAEILAFLAGWGATCDAHHATAPLPDGSGAARAMRLALADAALAPEATDYVCAHGTATPDNDRSEAAAMRLVFGNRVPPFSSLKGHFGHTLAASGAVESVVSLLAIRHGAIPPGAGFREADPELRIRPVTRYEPTPPRVVIKNAFGFGGGNVALVFTAPQSATADIPAAASVPVSTRPVYVRALEAVTPCGPSITDLFAAASSGRMPEPQPYDLSRFSEGLATNAMRCPALPEKEELPAAARRRMSRLLKMSILPALRCARGLADDPLSPEDVSVFMGTGAGCLDDTMTFVENAILKEEREPMPVKFVHSVHNAPASQIALMIGARGTNSAPTHGEISFEAALSQAMDELALGRTRRAWVGAADELSPHHLAAGCRLGWWDRITPGEGSVVAVLESPDADRKAPESASFVPVCQVEFCRIRHHGTRRRRNSESGSAADAGWIEDLLREAGLAPGDIDLVLECGAVPAAPSEGESIAAEIIADLSRRADRKIPRARIDPFCGTFHSASAVGFALAAGLVSGQIPVTGILPAPAHAADPAQAPDDCRVALLLTASSGGGLAATCIRAA